MKPTAMLLAAGALATLVACGSKESPTTASGSSAASGSAHAADHKLAELTPDEVEAKLAKNDGSVFVYDNNNKKMFESGHVPGAKWLPIDDIKESDLAPNKDATLIFYCSNTH